MSNYFVKDKPLSEEDIRRIRSAFHDADLNFKGYLMREDLKIAFAILFGYKPSKYELNQALTAAKITAEQGSGVSEEQFVQLITPKFAARDEDEEIRQAFVAFDTHCKGFISVDNLHSIVKQVAPKLPSTTIEAAFKEIDRDGDGRVSYKDFEFMMKYSLEDNL